MLAQIRPAVSLIAIFTLLCGVVFPLAFSAFGALVLPFQSGGSLIVQNGKVIGSAIIGQNFTSAKYFQGRPSALMGADPKDASKQVPTPYDAGESGASNLAPTSKALVDRVKAAATAFPSAPAPGDSITTSGSGLDPDISPATAAAQVARIAKARHMTPSVVQGLVDTHVEGRLLGVIGEPHVNVLVLNLALDAALAGSAAPAASIPPAAGPGSKS
jgi:K+-transporting ATPase ATPase C chain